MAGKAKSWYITVADTEDKHKTVFTKMFFDVNAMHKWVKENEEKYPKPKYYISKENY